ncbi:MAG: MBL fold metallo-hydrolase [Tepidanaerobacteraceae bacterium]|jgi:glyoxylase-like metal-dependent hydrolase (beta-lactamase superfamily II)
MVQKLFHGLFKIDVPLPRNPLKSLNVYLFKSKQRNLIIDTGMNRPECMHAMLSGLRELDIDLHDTDFLITHMHADHSGLISSLVTSSSRIYCSERDAGYINASAKKDYWQGMSIFAQTGGFPEKDLQEAINKHPGNRYSSEGCLNFTYVKEKDNIKIGDYFFYCVETPGHTKGHICLYEPEKKLFVAGDHILDDITPNISLIKDREDENPLDDYINSLDKVYEYDVRIVLPGHRAIFSNYKERINQLKQHHLKRTDEVFSILSTGGWKSAYEIASLMKWDLSDSFIKFPVSQKWFATGEALAHLKYLERKGMVNKKWIDSCFRYSRK